ncbi:hypothetical protein PHMEG_00011979 [Phytophthora megakarya]|uniref:RxLR effector protein n=1 Tax=Phytophthora megakarya TaxID=4795 RepID=A0A225WBB6_9STRA|nr:hypothetical protein PHMEG_00011979 [Phytophthora megakarya]
MRLRFILFVIAVTEFISSDAVLTATTTGDMVTSRVMTDVTNGTRFLRTISTVNDIDDEDEERVLEVFKLWRGKRGSFDDPNLEAGFTKIMGWFHSWKGQTDDEVTKSIHAAVTKSKNRDILRTMWDMYQKDGEKKLRATLVEQSKKVKDGRRM